MLAVEDVDTEDLGLVESKGEGQLVKLGEEACSSSHLIEGILINNPRLRIKEANLGKLRYLYKFPKSEEIRAPKTHERVDWVMPGWVALYELPFQDGMRFPIPNLVRVVLEHFEIAPSHLMPNMW